MNERQRVRLRGRVIRLAAGVAAVAIVVLGIVVFHVTYNFTNSMPIGFYSLAPVAGAVRPGRIVAVCAPAAVARFGLRRRYLRAGTCPNGTAYLLKIVVAANGDHVEVRERGVYVNGSRLPGSGRLRADYLGRRMPSIARGTYVLRAGEVWLWTPNPHSWDSRYYGPVNRADVVGFATLILPIGSWPYANGRG